jgi:hypothetical protein
MVAKVLQLPILTRCSPEGTSELFHITKRKALWVTHQCRISRWEARTMGTRQWRNRHGLGKWILLLAWPPGTCPLGNVSNYCTEGMRMLSRPETTTLIPSFSSGTLSVPRRSTDAEISHHLRVLVKWVVMTSNHMQPNWLSQTSKRGP